MNATPDPHPEWHCHPLDLRLRHTFRTARGPSDTRHNVLVELRYGEHVAWGEAAPIERYDQDAASAERAITRMAVHIEDPRHFDHAVEDASMSSKIVDQPAACAAVDMALRDLVGKRHSAPLYEILGLNPNATPLSTFTIGLADPETVARKVKEATDYEILKIKLGSEDDHAVMEAVRDTTRQRLVVDANEGWTFEEALSNVLWLKDMDVEFVEQPLPVSQFNATRELRHLSPMPIIADESVRRAVDIPELAKAFDGVNIKLMKCGGIGEALRMIAVARAHGMQVMLGCMIESSVANTAAAQISPLVDLADLDGHLLVKNDPFSGMVLDGGRVRLPEGPGLGVVRRG